MSLWKHLFDSDYKQRADIEDLKDDLQAATAASLDASSEQGGSIRSLKRRVNQLELMVETLVTYLEEHNNLDRDAFEQLMIQVDLADGYADGRIGPDRVDKAPKCKECGKPVSRKRDECVYCGAEVPKQQRRRRGRRR